MNHSINFGEETRAVTNVQEKNSFAFLDSIYTSGHCRVQRVSDKTRQIAGADVDMVKYLGGKKRKLTVDEKMATSYRDGYDRLHTFSFEVSSENNPGGIGWLFQDGLETTHYALGWLSSGDNFASFSDYCIAVICKKRVLAILEEAGITCREDVMNALAAVPEDDGTIGKRETKINGIRIIQSTHLRERPVNVLLTRKQLIEAAVLVFDSRKGVKVNDENAAADRKL